MVLNRTKQPDQSFWRGRRVLLTGHTGFKGAWLAFWLNRLGASVTGLSLPPATDPSLFNLLGIEAHCAHRIGDIRNAALVRSVVQSLQPEVVLHLAAQALVRTGYQDAIGTFETNVMGSAHVLEALKYSTETRVAVMITTDKVYRNREWVWPYREDDPLGGFDPYSASKAACEMVIESWRQSFLAERGIAVASARAGNVIGGGDWSANRLLPDAVRAWQTQVPLVLRRPEAVRPWQHVLEPLAGYLALAEHLWQAPEAAGAYNFGPHAHEVATVREMIDFAREPFPHAEVIYGDGSEGPHEAGLLALDASRARTVLGVGPRFNLSESVRRTMDWHIAFAGGASATELCDADLEAWSAAA